MELNGYGPSSYGTRLYAKIPITVACEQMTVLMQFEAQGAAVQNPIKLAWSGSPPNQVSTVTRWRRVKRKQRRVRTLKAETNLR